MHYRLHNLVDSAFSSLDFKGILLYFNCLDITFDNENYKELLFNAFLTSE